MRKAQAKVVHSRDHKTPDGYSFDYNQIADQIFLGTNACCEMGFNDELLKQGIVGDISLESERIDNPEGVDYFLWLPVDDHYAPTSKQMKLGIQTIDFFVENKIKFYVHCKLGHGRAPTLLMGYFIAKGMSVQAAVDFVRSKRDSVHPNKKQRAALLRLKKSKFRV